jgi:prevent-host-death family protein
MAWWPTSPRPPSGAPSPQGRSELLDLVEHGGERIAITRRGETAAVLVSIADFERLTGGSAG